MYAVEARSADTAFATTSPGGGGTGTFIYRTTNRGTTWTQVYTDPNAAAFINTMKMIDNNNGIAMGDPVGGKWVILRTSDGGASWTRDTANAPLQVASEAGSNNGMAVVGSTHIWFPANNTTKVYRSTNGGATWASSTPPYTATFTAGIWFNNTQLGLIGANGGQAARTTDGGATWTSVTIGTTGAVYGVWGSGSDFFASRGANIYRSTDGGVTWTTSWTGTIGTTLWHCNFATVGSNTRGYVVSSTGGIGAFYGGLTGVRERTGGTLPQTFTLAQNYPNPFNPTTTIQYDLPRSAHVTLKIYNTLGQEVRTLLNEVGTVGAYDILWDGRNSSGGTVASGVYFYRIEARPIDGSVAFSSIKKMLLLK